MTRIAARLESPPDEETEAEAQRPPRFRVAGVRAYRKVKTRGSSRLRSRTELTW